MYALRGVPRGVSRGFRKPLLDFITISASQIVYQLYLTKTISIIGKNLTYYTVANNLQLAAYHLTRL